MTVTDRIYDLSTLWKQASIVFPYFDRQTVDWDLAYREFLPRAAEAEEERSFHLLLAEFLNLLGDGHTDYWLPKHLVDEVGMLPFSLKYVDGSYCVSAIKEDGARHLAAEVLSINGSSMAEVISTLSRYIYRVRDFVPPSKLHRFLPLLLKPTRNAMETSAGTYCFDLERTPPSLVEHKAPEASVPYEAIPSGKLTLRVYDGNVLYAKMDSFLHDGAAGELAAALRSCRHLRGVILDVRDNIGGMTAFGRDVAGLFISGQFHSCQKRTRTMTGSDIASSGQILDTSEAAREKQIALGWYDRDAIDHCLKVNSNTFYEEYVDTVGTPDHVAPFPGLSCVVLTSRNTLSAAEDFVAMFKSTRRAVILGEPTQGSTGTPLNLRLSCGGRARICSIGYRLLDGTEFIGSGIQPDILLPMGAGDYAAGRDAVLEYALKRIGHSLGL